MTLDIGITNKMPTLKITVNEWQTIRAELHKEHPKSVFMLKNKMRQVLGFTVREHQEWIPIARAEEKEGFDLFSTGADGWYKDKRHEISIRLDFYNERKYTMFMLKFSEYIK